jgi:hypothetical protein
MVRSACKNAKITIVTIIFFQSISVGFENSNSVFDVFPIL